MAQSVQTERVPGVDMKVKILFTKVISNVIVNAVRY